MEKFLTDFGNLNLKKIKGDAWGGFRVRNWDVLILKIFKNIWLVQSGLRGSHSRVTTR